MYLHNYELYRIETIQWIKEINKAKEISKAATLGRISKPTHLKKKSEKKTANFEVFTCYSLNLLYFSFFHVEIFLPFVVV